MIKILMHGCNGAMGRVIAQLAEKDAGVEITAGIDVNGQQLFSYPVFPSLADCTKEADVIIDFSSAVAVDILLDYSMAKNIPVVVCTTGLSQVQTDKIQETSQKTAVLRSANMSVGVNLLLKMVREAAATLAAADFDIEIIEKHHNQKVDAPSGTALALADSMNEALGNTFHYQYDRTLERSKRDKKEIGIQSVRGGSIVGEHDVIFAGTDEVITFSHTAYSKAIFAKGALEAAKFLAGKPKGLYSMADVIDAAVPSMF